LTLDSNKLAKLEKKLNKYYSKDYISTCNVALYGDGSSTNHQISGSYVAANYLSILKALGSKGTEARRQEPTPSALMVVGEGDIEI